MKKLEIIVRRDKVDALKSKLNEMGASGITLSNIAGFGKEESYTQKYRGQEYTFYTVQKIRVECIVLDHRLDEFIDAIIETAQTGNQGDGKIYVYDVCDAVRIRTGERGESAL